MKEDRHFFELTIRMLQRNHCDEKQAVEHLVDWMKKRKGKFMRNGFWIGMICYSIADAIHYYFVK